MDIFLQTKQRLSLTGIVFRGTQTFQSPADMLPEEAPMVTTACDSRQREVATGRWCAREALQELGLGRPAILRGPAGEPLWPTGVCGSISHTKDACCAVVAPCSRYQSLGIDIEQQDRRITPEMARLFVNDDERPWVGSDAACSDRFRLVFCIKECAYKLLYPLVRTFLPFSAVSVLPPADGGGFTFRLNKRLSDDLPEGMVVQGSVFQDNSWLLALAALPAV